MAPRISGALRPLGLDEVTLTDGFWGELNRLNALSVIPHCLQWIRRVGTMDNFLPPQQRPKPERRGVLFTDSDAYKVIEALVWEVGRVGSPESERQLRTLTEYVGRAIEVDGYINTHGAPIPTGSGIQTCRWATSCTAWATSYRPGWPGCARTAPIP